MILRLSNPMSAVVWLAFLLPTTLLAPWADRALGAAVFFLAVMTLFTQPSPWESRKPSATALRFFLLLEFFYLFSAFYSAGFNGSSLGAWSWFELFRYVILGGFAVYLIRHHDAGVRKATEWAMTASLYAALVFPAADPQGYVSVLTFCWLLFFSRLRLRYLHAATAVLVVSLSGDPMSRAAAFAALSTAFALAGHRRLKRGTARSRALLSFLFWAALLIGAAVAVRAVRGPSAAIAPSEAEALQFIRRSPVFGWGPVPSGAILGRSQYLFWMLKGGALGAAVILAGLLLAGYRLLRAEIGVPTRLAGAAVFLGVVALMLFDGRFLESYRLCFLTAFFAAGMSEAAR